MARLKADDMAQIICEELSGYEGERLNDAGRERYRDVARTVLTAEIRLSFKELEAQYG